MSLYQYKAKKGATETLTGRIEARTRDEAVELVHKLGLIPISIEEYQAGATQKWRLATGQIKTKDLYLFSRQLAHLLKAGIPILRALQLINEQTHNARLQNVIRVIHDGIKAGRSFSECLSDYPQVFSSLYVAMVRAGEEGGNLREMLLRISEYLKAQEEISAKVRTALAYPIFMAVVGLGTIIFILTNVMPRITPLFANMGEQLPMPTRVLMSISDLFRGSWCWIALILLILLFLIIQWGKSTAGRLSLTRFQMRLPLFGDLLLKVEISRFCRTLELLLKSGVSLIRSLEIAIPTLNNKLIQDQLVKCQEDIKTGVSLGESLKKAILIPVMVHNLIMVGEESGNLDDTLKDIADSYDQDASEKIKTATTLIEPAMILIVGLVIGFMVMAMLLPIFQMDILAG